MKTIYVSRNQNGVVGIIPDDKFKMVYINILHFNGESIDGRSGPTIGRSKEAIIYSFRNTLSCDIYEISFPEEKDMKYRFLTHIPNDVLGEFYNDTKSSFSGISIIDFHMYYDITYLKYIHRRSRV